MLEIDDLSAGYGEVGVLSAISFTQASGEVLGVLGRNGAGKTTLLKTIMGIVPIKTGDIRLDGRSLSEIPPHSVAALGIALVPQGRRLFPQMTVRENLTMGLLVGRADTQTMNEALALFPEISERLSQRAGTLSGGQQQMVAMARALCVKPKLLLLDEPSEGLMPALVERVLKTVRTLRDEGVSVMLVEQRIESVLQCADRVLLMENGELKHEATPRALRESPAPLERYVGVRKRQESKSR